MCKGMGKGETTTLSWDVDGKGGDSEGGQVGRIWTGKVYADGNVEPPRVFVEEDLPLCGSVEMYY